MTPRPRVAVTGTVLALALGALTGCTGEAAEQEPAAPAAVAGPDSEHLLLHGTLTRGDEPLADAEVALLLEPENPTDIEVGDTVEYLEAARVTTDERGGYRLDVDPDELRSRYFNGDFLNFTLHVTDGDELLVWHGTGELVRQEFWRSDDRALVGDPALRIDADLDTETLTTTDSLGARTEDEAIVVELGS